MMVFGFGKCVSVLMVVIEMCEVSVSVRMSEDGVRGGDVSASGRARDASTSEWFGNYGSLSYGGYGWEMMYDVDEVWMFG